MRPVHGAFVLVAASLGLIACADEERPPAAFPTEAVGPSGLPPPLYVTTTSGGCSDQDETGCEVRCAAGDADACARLHAGAVAEGPPPAAAPVQVNTPRGAVQFFGPVGAVHIDPAGPR